MAFYVVVVVGETCSGKASLVESKLEEEEIYTCILGWEVEEMCSGMVSWVVVGESCSGRASWVESKLEEVVTCSGKALWVVVVTCNSREEKLAVNISWEEGVMSMRSLQWFLMGSLEKLVLLREY
ncbi:hypothetical protein PanWU01x14_036780 [Parasponia andersonii]|uniref:Uncharacterized protein n=1 Tax=Parasponia andersonii TaxID=3476 RepID=A0A2P5DSJ8_PARAD|nr:hypothetical protein PanWU01x14_036780 [Parasponia andersonii]